MTPQTIPQTVLFPDLFDKPLVATFDRQHASSDGGAVLLKAAERVYGLLAGFARCLVDRSGTRGVARQRIFGIAGNDARRPDPQAAARAGPGGRGVGLAPTSRFENGVGRSALYAWDASWRCGSSSGISRAGRAGAADRSTHDDATHGAQQLTFFNGHYDSWCYLPLLAFLTFDQEREQYLCAAVLRPGNVPATRGTVGVLCRLLPLLRQAFPQARFLVRLDGGFAMSPRLDYVVAMAKNAVLQRHAEPALLVAQAQSAASGQTAHVYADTRYRARTWDRDRRVVIKARSSGSATASDLSMNGSTAPAATSRTGSRSCSMAHELLSLLGQSTARAPHRRRLRTDARTPAARGAHRLCPRPSDVAARPAPQGAHVVGSVRRVVLHLPTRRTFGAHSAPAPDRPPPAPVSRAYRIPTAHRARPWRRL